ncbi:MAG: hypothetical protein J5787_02445 [Alphaproteobacteria bacterium]|nr:hypothetical protein [Alphaproteobacteria bacterium]MBO4643431.1 hypothetical protein [Alphaproteobacteria bacterium]
MKKEVLTGLVLFCATACPAFADGMKTFGTVEQIAAAENTFTVRGDDGHMYLFNINEMTEMEKNGKWFDEEVSLTDLNTGDRVQVEYFADNPDYLIVDEVEIFPPKTKKQMKNKKKK